MKKNRQLILIVDDFKNIRDAYADMLMKENFVVAMAGNGEEGRTMARELKPDLILMDMSLPGISGLETSRALRSDEITKSIPILLLTAHGPEIFSALPADLQIHGVITKPCLPEALLAEIRRALADQPLAAKVRGQTATG